MDLRPEMVVERISVAPPESVVFVEMADSAVAESLLRFLRRQLPVTGRRLPVVLVFLAPPSRAMVRRHILPALWTLVCWAWRGWRSGG